VRDDLYICHPVCAEILEAGMDFLLTYKDESHPWIAEQAANSLSEIHEKWEWNGRNHLVYRYRWVNGIENRAEGEKLTVNYLYFEIYNEEKGEITYENSWISNHPLGKDTVKGIAERARARWKIEHKHNNVLKRRGYNLEHNFGHGESHARGIFFLLNLLAFFSRDTGYLWRGVPKGPWIVWQAGRFFLGFTLRS
jgi:hypothetical protein